MFLRLCSKILLFYQIKHRKTKKNKEKEGKQRETKENKGKQRKTKKNKENDRQTDRQTDSQATDRGQHLVLARDPVFLMFFL